MWEKSKFRRRAWEAISSVVFSRIVRTGEQFILVPIFLSAWGVDTYGEWLTLTAMTAFLSFTNFGLGQAAASEIIMAIGAGDRERAQRAFSSSAFMLSVIALVVIAILVVISLKVDISTLAGFVKLGRLETAIIVSCTGITVILQFFNAPISAALSATIGAGRANLLSTSIKIVEIILIAFVLLEGGSPKSAALIMLLSVAMLIVLQLAFLQRLTPWLRLLLFETDKESLLWMLKPSIGYFTLYVSVNLVGTQLPRIILFSALGSSAVTIFSVTTTYARTIRVLSGIISPALQVEVGYAYGAADPSRFVNLVNKMCRISVWSAIVLGGGLFIGSFFLIPFWTNGAVSVNLILLLLLIAGSVIGSLADPIMNALTIINRVGIIAWTHLVTLLLGLAVSSIFLSRFGPAAIAAALVVPDVVVILIGRREIGRNEGEIELLRLRELVRWPGDLLQREFNALWSSSLVSKFLGR